MSIYLSILQAEDPLDQAIYFLKPLQTLSANCVDVHVKAYEIYSRKGKYSFFFFKSTLRML